LRSGQRGLDVGVRVHPPAVRLHQPDQVPAHVGVVLDQQQSACIRVRISGGEPLAPLLGRDR